MSHDREYDPGEDSFYSGEAPTLSGYRAYAAVMDGGDRSRIRELEREQFEQWRKHWFKPKPAIVHYEELHKVERRLSDNDTRSYLSMGIGFVAHARENQLPRLDKSTDRKATAEYIKIRYGQWEQDHRELQARQRASFDADVEKAVRLRQNHRQNMQSHDNSGFFARREVVNEYSHQHHDLNRDFEQDVVGFVDQIVEQQVERNRQRMGWSEGAALDEIVRRPRQSDRDHGRER